MMMLSLYLTCTNKSVSFFFPLQRMPYLGNRYAMWVYIRHIRRCTKWLLLYNLLIINVFWITRKWIFGVCFFQPACPPGYVCHDGHCDRGELRYYDLLHVSSGPRMVKSITIYSHSLVQLVVNSLPRHNPSFKV